MKFSREMLKGIAPYILLQTLYELKEAYGYQLMKTIKEQSDEVFEFKESTLYPILYRLEEKGYVTSEIKQVPGKKDRRYYWVTDDGKAYLGVKENEMKVYLDAIRRFLPGQTMA